MPWYAWLILVVVVIIFLIVGFRNANHNYTIGSGMFKNSDNNLDRDEHLDPSDYDYYNKKDKLK